MNKGGGLSDSPRSSEDSSVQQISSFDSPYRIRNTKRMQSLFCSFCRYIAANEASILHALSRGYMQNKNICKNVL